MQLTSPADLDDLIKQLPSVARIEDTGVISITYSILDDMCAIHLTEAMFRDVVKEYTCHPFDATYNQMFKHLPNGFKVFALTSRDRN